MTPWILLLFTLFFGYLTYDAWALYVPNHKPNAQFPSWWFTKKLTPKEREKLTLFYQRHGVGNVNQSVWLFGILTFGCAVASFMAFIE